MHTAPTLNSRTQAPPVSPDSRTPCASVSSIPTVGSRRPCSPARDQGPRSARHPRLGPRLIAPNAHGPAARHPPRDVRTARCDGTASVNACRSAVDDAGRRTAPGPPLSRRQHGHRAPPRALPFDPPAVDERADDPRPSGLGHRRPGEQVALPERTVRLPQAGKDAVGRGGLPPIHSVRLPRGRRLRGGKRRSLAGAGGMAIRATRPHQRHAHRLRDAAPSSPAAAASTRYENPAPLLTGAKNRLQQEPKGPPRMSPRF